MRRKRLNHIADNLCQMFCGWRQIFSKPQLIQLGSGRLEIDILTGTCVFNGSPIDPLPIASELRQWMEGDLAHNGIPKSELTVASVSAEIGLETVPWDSGVGTKFFAKGEPIQSGPMHQAVVKCSSTVRSGEAEYRGYRHDMERWPVGWPAA